MSRRGMTRMAQVQSQRRGAGTSRRGGARLAQGQRARESWTGEKSTRHLRSVPPIHALNRHSSPQILCLLALPRPPELIAHGRESSMTHCRPHTIAHTNFQGSLSFSATGEPIMRKPRPASASSSESPPLPHPPGQQPAHSPSDCGVPTAFETHFDGHNHSWKFLWQASVRQRVRSSNCMEAQHAKTTRRGGAFLRTPIPPHKASADQRPSTSGF